MDYVTSAPSVAPHDPFGDAVMREIIYGVMNFQVAFVLGPSNNKMSTFIPLGLLEHCDGLITPSKRMVLVEPHRSLAISLSNQASQQLDAKYGGIISQTRPLGFCGIYDDRTTISTRIVYTTGDSFLRNILEDPLLGKYSVIMLDDAHERSFDGDLILALLKKILLRNSTLKIIVCGAIQEGSRLFNFFSGFSKTAIQVKTPCFPPQIFHTRVNPPDVLKAAFQLVCKLATKPVDGSIVIFLAGRDDILSLRKMLESVSLLNSVFDLVEVFSKVPASDQAKLLKSGPKPKILLATNVAESYISLPKISYVIDCGTIKMKVWDSHLGSSRLILARVPKCSAIQRALKCADESPGGIVYRLYSKETFQHRMLDFSIPEMQRTDWTHMLLLCKALGIERLSEFDFPCRPPNELLYVGESLLTNLGILDLAGSLVNPYGILAASLPCNPRLAACMLQAQQEDCLLDFIYISALLSVEAAPYYRENNELEKFLVEEGDVFSLLNLYLAFLNAENANKFCQRRGLNESVLATVSRIVAVFKKIFCKFGASHFNSCLHLADSDVIIRKILIRGFYDQVGLAQPDGSYRSLINPSLSLYIHPESSLFKKTPPCILYTNLETTTKIFCKFCTVIEPMWLVDIKPELYASQASLSTFL